MADYIERDKVLEAILNLPPKMDEQGYGWLGRMGVWQMIRDFQSADVAPVVHGRWISIGHKLSRICSVCNCDEPYKFADDDANVYDYCPNCGAKMDGGENG